jgi:redox-sensitive bicupin YhaK (pirin superfamily)
MIDPSYQDVQKDKIPVIKKDKFTVRLVAGEAFGEKSSVNTHVPIHYLDVHAEEGAVFEYNIPTCVSHWGKRVELISFVIGN